MAGDILLGQVLGHFCLLQQIGAGGMGVVYRAHDQRLQRDVAVKVLPAGSLVDDAARKRFKQEALALAPPRQQAELRSRLDSYKSGKPFRMALVP